MKNNLIDGGPHVDDESDWNGEDGVETAEELATASPAKTPPPLPGKNVPTVTENKVTPPASPVGESFPDDLRVCFSILHKREHAWDCRSAKLTREQKIELFQALKRIRKHVLALQQDPMPKVNIDANDMAKNAKSPAFKARVERVRQRIRKSLQKNTAEKIV